MQIQKALVLGMARSGAAAARLLLARGCEVTICDVKPREQFVGALDDLDVPGVRWQLGVEDPLPLIEGMDALIVSPGIPDTHPAVLRARELGVEVMGELEYAYRESTGTLLAVTGTNGKTTTSTLLGEIFKNAGRRTWVVGNIGAPYAQAVLKMRAGDVTVCEVSSFQLETVSQFHPSVAAVLNVTEDHLNRHGTMENYTALKERVFANCREGDFVVLNYDNAITRAMAAHTRAKVVWFSRSGEAPSGALAREGKVVFVDEGGERPVCDASEIYIPGPHNLENALAATAMALSAGVPAPVVRHTLRAFQGVEHRLEFVRELDGVRYINDSKGTNVDSTLWAVRSMTAPTVIILGGSYKKADYHPLGRELMRGNITHAVLIGDTADAIEAALKDEGFTRCVRAGYDFPKAIATARSLAAPGGNVLLSPACASFDMFTDYEARGREFKRIVKDLEPNMA